MSVTKESPGTQGVPLPTGTVTYVLSGIEGSARLWEERPSAMAEAVARHDRVIAEAVGAHGGALLKTRGEGDGAFAVFAGAGDAVACALRIQRGLSSEQWPEDLSLRVRMALHTGEAEADGGDHFGPAVNRCAKLRAAAHGGQTVLSEATTSLVRDQLPDGATLRDLGPHRLKDLARPERVFQLCHPDLAAEFPALLSLDSFPNNLPGQLTTFVGREKEIDEAKLLLSGTRLLTLTGAGGAGKSRMAVQLAAEVLERFPDGVWLADVAYISDPDLVPQEVARAVGARRPAVSMAVVPAPAEVDAAREPGYRDSTEFLIGHLKDKGLLLAIDNCEHLVDACAALAERLLRSCPRITIVATSREPLGVSGETSWKVPSLSMPDPYWGPGTRSLGAYAAVKLFVDRALRVRPDFQLTDDNAPAIAQICRRLDGIPLAIELAAARVKVMAPDEIAARLDDRFRLLTGGRRSSVPRQRTLGATVDWSFHLLTERERTLLRRLAVFAGGCSLEAAEAVASGEGIEAHEVLDLLSQLVDKSLVVSESGRETRYRLTETVRQYAGEKLMDSEEAAGLRGRHLDWHVALAERGEPELRGPEQGRWDERLEADHENFRAALEWSLATGSGGKALRLAGSLWRFWALRQYLSEGRAWLNKVLATGRESSTERARALHGAGVLAFWDGDLEGAASLLQEGLAAARELGYERGVAASLLQLGWLAAERGNPGVQHSLAEDSLGMFRRLGDKHGIADSLACLATATYLRGDYPQARGLMEEGVAVRRELGDKGTIARHLRQLAMWTETQGDLPRARSLLEEALVLARESGRKAPVTDSLCRLAGLRGRRGDYAAAELLNEEALQIARNTRDRHSIAAVLYAMGYFEFERGDFARAGVLFEEALTTFKGASIKWGIPQVEIALGYVAEARGDYSRAQARFEEGLRIYREYGQWWGVAWALSEVGHQALHRGDHDAARSALEEALRVSREADDRLSVAWALARLGELATSEGDLSKAASLLEESLAICRDVGRKRHLAVSLEGIARVERLRENFVEASALLREALEARKATALPHVPRSLEMIAGIEGELGRHARAARLFGAAAAARERLGFPVLPWEEDEHRSNLGRVREALGEPDFPTAWSEGRAMTLDEAAALAQSG